MIHRTLLLINKTAGLGEALLARLRQRLERRLGQAVVAEVVEGHSQTTAATIDFLRTNGQVTIIVAGGSGTLRAVVEAVCRKRPAALKGSAVTLALLRLGSGNVLAKHLGIPQDPLRALDVIADGILSGRTVLHPIIQAQTRRRIFYGATLCGIGQFGRVPTDLAWHASHPLLSRVLGGIPGIERATLLGYPRALLRRCLGCAFSPAAADNVLLHTSAGRHSIPLLAGAIMTFPLSALPFKPTASGATPSVSAHLLPWSRTSALLLAPCLRCVSRRAINVTLLATEIITLSAPGTHPFVIDEDRETFNGWLAIGCAGRLPFITGAR